MPRASLNFHYFAGLWLDLGLHRTSRRRIQPASAVPRAVLQAGNRIRGTSCWKRRNRRSVQLPAAVGTGNDRVVGPPGFAPRGEARRAGAERPVTLVDPPRPSEAREWWAHQDSNLGRTGYEPAALTAE